MKIIKHKIAISAILSAFLFFGCDHMQDSLSVVIQEKVDEDTGSAYVADSNWYYNGTSSTDMTGDTTASLRILFTRMVRLDSLSGKFSVSYTDSNSGKTVTTERDLNGGTLSEDYCSYNLNMSPITGMLDGATPVNGKISVTLSLSGFVCLAGNQSGRSIPALSQKINVLPLYSSLSHTFTTTSATAGYQFAIPVEGSVSLSSDATISVGEKPALFALDGVSSDGKSILFSPTESIEREVFNSDIVITGIRPTSSGTDYSAVFSGTFVPGAVTSDTLATPLTNYGLSQVIAYDDGENLNVIIIGDGNIQCYEKHNITILVDNESKTSSGVMTTEPVWPEINGEYPMRFDIATTSSEASGTSVDAEITTYLAQGGNVYNYYKYLDGDTLTYESATVTTDGTTALTSSLSQNSDWYYDFGTTSLYYSIPLSKIGASSGDIVKICAIRTIGTEEKSGIADCAPTAAVTLSDGSAITVDTDWAGQNVIIDMSKALEYTIE